MHDRREMLAMFKNQTLNRTICCLGVFLIVATLLVGLYHEPLSCIASLCLLWMLWRNNSRRGEMQIPLTTAVIITFVIAGCYGLSTMWAADQGMAIFGFVKFLPLPLFALTATQLSGSQRTSLLQMIPWIGVGTTILTGALGFFSKTAPYVFVNGRLAGTFQYPNTFALFLLVGMILLTTTPHKNYSWIAGIAVLAAGIAFTGSRTVFVLLILSIALLCVFFKDRCIRFVLAGSGLLLILSTVIYTVVTGDIASLGRYLTISLESSTLQGRLLYWQDALPIILRHPFGLGYMGYNSLLGSFQTGVYSLTHVHNEVLQLLLDIGWIPGVLFLYMIGRGVCSKTVDFRNKLCIGMIFLHTLMDFDLQFPIIWFILLLCLTEDVTEKTIHIHRGVTFAAVVMGCLCLYFGTVSGLYYTGKIETCAKLYPYHTQANSMLLQQAETAEEMDVFAQQVLKVNPSSSLAWSAKARAAYANGNFEWVIQYKEKAISLARYAKEEYLDYFEMLWVGYQLYLQNGDVASAEVCRQKLLIIPQMMEDVLASTSERAWRITDKPDLVLPDEYRQILQILQQ